MQLGFVVVRGQSMEPTYRDGDRLLVLYGARPKVGVAHVVQLPDGPDGARPLAIKRVTRQDGFDAHRKPTWWVERDNPRVGVDSWLVGALPSSNMRARVLMTWPPHLRGGWLPLPAAPLNSHCLNLQRSVRKMTAKTRDAIDKMRTRRR